jgi:transposase-like protein
MVEGATNMARVGRKPQGWKLIDRLSAEESCKARLKAFLETMAGQGTVAEACRKLGIEQSRFFALRNHWLQEAVDLLAPKPAGRPRKAGPDEPQVEELKQEVHDLKQRLLAAELRAKLAEAGVSRPSQKRQKKGAPR